MNRSLFLLSFCFFGCVTAGAQEIRGNYDRFQRIEKLYQNGHYQQARDLLDPLIEVLEQQPKDPLLFDSYLLKYQLNRNLYKNKSALRAIEKARKIHTEHLAYEYKRKELLLQHGLALALNDRFSKAVEYLEEAEVLLTNESENDSSGLALLYFAKAILPVNVEKKIQFNSKALQFTSPRDANFPYLKGQTLRRFANSCRVQADFQQAVKYYQQELDHYQLHFSADHFDIAVAHYNLGSVYYELLEYQKALDHYLAAYPNWRKRFRPQDSYMRFINEAMGDLYFELNDEEKALYYYDQSVLEEEIIDNDSSLLLTEKGEEWLKAGQPELAMQYYEQALKFREENFGKIHPLTGACNNFIARVYKSREQTGQALAAYQQSLIRMDRSFVDTNIYTNPVVSIEHSLNPYFLEALYAKGELFFIKFESSRDIRDLEMAWISLQQCIEIIDLIRQSPITESSKIHWTQKAFPIYEQAIRTALLLAKEKKEESYLAEGFYISEKSKSFLLLSSIHARDINRFYGIPQPLIEQEIQLKSEITLYNGKIISEEKRCSAMRQKKLGLWNEKLLMLQQEYKEYLKKVERSYPEYFRLKYEISNCDLPRLQNRLKENKQALIEYFEGEEKGYVFVLDGQGVKVHTYQRDSSQLTQIRTLRDWLSRPGRQSRRGSFHSSTAIAYQLYQKILKTPLSYLSDSLSRLIIIPDGLLSYLSFECLLSEPPEAGERSYIRLPFLLRRYAISYGQSASLIDKSYAAQPPAGNISFPFLGIAPDYASPSPLEGRVDSTLTPLHFNKSEIELAASLVDGKVLTGPQASRPAFLSLAPQAGMLHLALHAKASDEDPLLSSLHFSGTSDSSARLYAYELYNMHINAQLTVLSACNTGTGKWIRGEGIMSLSRCFQYAGCPSILTSLWTIDDQSTSELMGAFYENINAGEPKDQALQKAKLQYLNAADPATAHPAYWAAFILIGNTQPIQLSDKRSLWSYGIPLLVGILIWGFYRRRT